MAAIEAVLLNLLAIVGVAVVARTLATQSEKVPYPVVLVVAGLLVSVFRLDIALGISHDLIFFVFLPPILFAGSLRLDVGGFKGHLPLVALLLVVALPMSILLLGALLNRFTRFPLLVSLLLASMLYPLDPAAILSVFKQMGAPDQLRSIIEGEPLFDDGLAVVIFSTLLEVLETQSIGESPEAVANPLFDPAVLADLLTVSVGGLAVGAALSAVVFVAGSQLIDDKLTELLLSGFVAYGSMLIAEHYVHVSGILAVVAAGIVGRVAERRESLSDETVEFVQSTWEIIEFLVSTSIYLLIGALVNVESLIANWHLILLSVAAFLIVRALMVYTLTPIANRFMERDVPTSYRHVLVWGALHTVVPIAMVLSLPPDTPYRSVLHTVVFGAAIVSIVAQGLSIPYVLRFTGIVD